MNRVLRLISGLIVSINLVSCSHTKPSGDVSPDEASKLDRKLVRETVVFEDGTKEGATVPDISAPRLRAVLVREHVESGRLIETHREWILEGDVSILGIPSTKK